MTAPNLRPEGTCQSFDDCSDPAGPSGLCRRHFVRGMAAMGEPVPPRQVGGDRREGPRREAERLLHYAELGLHSAAVNWAEARRERQANGGPEPAIRYAEACERLADATATYEAAYRQETTPTPPG